MSERACIGVLRRAERRGKELKPILKLALEQQIERWRKYGSPLPVFGEETKICVIYDEENITSKVNASNPQIGGPCHTLGRTGEGRTLLCQCYDARGNGDGRIAPTVTGDHNNRITDYTTLVCEKFAENSSGDGISGTIDAHYYLGCGASGGKEREFVVCETHCYSQDAYDKYEETEHAATLRASGGIYGGGSENLVCAGFSAQSSAEAGLTFNENLSPTLQVGKCAAVVTEHHTHDFLVRMREGKDGGGKGALVQEDKSGTIACNNDQVLFQHTQTQYVVRRLTPLECCRLQGMPDFWTDGVEGSDAARYKLWGNGMALPNALYIMEGLVENDER